jgi:hypothetical protein
MDLSSVAEPYDFFAAQASTFTIFSYIVEKVQPFFKV